MKTTQIVEAVLFASDAPLNAEEIARADEALDEDRVEEAIRVLVDEYAEADRAFQIAEIAEGYQILTRPDFAPYLERFDTVPRSPRLSGPALETLAIVAYRQPIGRVEIEYIRGVSSSGVLRTLQDRGMIEVVGRGEGIGRPLLYGTTSRFLEHFGFQSLEDLPRPEELPVVLREAPPLDEEDEDDEGEEDEEGEGDDEEEAETEVESHEEEDGERMGEEPGEADDESEGESGAEASEAAAPEPREGGGHE